jgi:tyrosyl-tRNA synthetase
MSRHATKEITNQTTNQMTTQPTNQTMNKTASQLTDEMLEHSMKKILSIGEEIIGNDRLENLLKYKQKRIAYDGFEPSSYKGVHIAQGLIRTINVNKITSTGTKFVFWVADYFALLNLKMGGDITRIRKVGELMIHTWKACGMNMKNVEFIWASEEINKRSSEYWSLVFDIATKVNVKRTLRCTQIMGRKDFSEKKIENPNNNEPNETKETNETNNNDDTEDTNNIPYEEMLSSMKTSQIFYPIMQCADIFFLNIDICSLGMDQRKVNMLALEYCDIIGRKLKPIIVSHHMLMGLDGSDKMSKSNPDSAIFMDDTDDEIKRKIKKAFCEPCNIKKNPILEYFKYIVFEKEEIVYITVYDPVNKTSKLNEYKTYEHLEQDFANGQLYPNDIKECIKLYLKKYFEPVRKYFDENPEAYALRKEVKKFTQTTK